MTKDNLNKFASNNDYTDKGSYKLIRGDNTPTMIEFQFKTGFSKAFGYPYLATLDFNPSESIALGFTAGLVVIKGRNLQPLFKHLLQHKVTLIQEMPDDDFPEEDTFVGSIVVQEK